MSSPEPKHNRITAAEDNIVQPVFWQTPCNVLLWDSFRSKIIMKRNVRCIIFFCRAVFKKLFYEY